MPQTSASATITDLADRRERAESEAHERVDEALEAAREAAGDAFFAVLGDPSHADAEIRLLVAASFGDPTKEYTYTEARFAALRSQAPTDDAAKRAMALGILKAVSEPMYSRVLEAVEIMDRIETLAEAAAAGGQDAAEQLKALAPILFADR
ncbi:MAG TPA: hypothetical protein VGO71_21145 [Baekduia sp.]|nr:hypothetical protein [Baekduia sp.]